MQALVRYFFIGGIAALTDLSLFFLGAKILGFPYLTVGACSFVVATYANYILSIRFVFQSGIRFNKQHEILLVFLVSGIGLLIHQIALYTGIEAFSLPLMLAKISATGIVFLWNFWARRRFIFSDQMTDKPTSPDEAKNHAI
jgi:putative flippase GtrA